MIRAIIKYTLFALVVIVISTKIRIGQRTLSDQVHIGMSHAERVATPTLNRFKEWSTEKWNQSTFGRQASEVSESERRRLKSLIEELEQKHQ